MKSKLITIKTTSEALKMLRLVSALTAEKQYEILERLLTAELKRLDKKENK